MKKFLSLVLAALLVTLSVGGLAEDGEMNAAQNILYPQN